MLRAIARKYGIPRSAAMITHQSIDPSRRGETLSIADFVRLLERSGVWDPQTKRVIQPLQSP